MESTKGVACNSYSDCIENIDQLLESGIHRSTLLKSPFGTLFVVSSEGRDKGVFVSAISEPFKDHLNEIYVETETVENDGIELSGVFISTPSDNAATAGILGQMACDFIKHVDENEGRIDSESWFNGWRIAVGNRNTVKRVYDVVGELVALLYLQKGGYGPVWKGPDAGRHDISCVNFDFEVKSTVSNRIIPEVTISSGRQLDPTPGKELYLILCMFEESPSGIYSIDCLVKSLICNGYPSDMLERSLEKLDVNSTLSRNTRFDLLTKVRRYPVDSTFPRITAESFSGGHYPDHVVGLTYTLDLRDVFYDELDIDL